jgi:hypothetical protein
VKQLLAREHLIENKPSPTFPFTGPPSFFIATLVDRKGLTKAEFRATAASRSLAIEMSK